MVAEALWIRMLQVGNRRGRFGPCLHAFTHHVLGSELP